MAIQTLIGRIERELPAKSLEGTELEMAVNLISTYSRKHIISSIMQHQHTLHYFQIFNYFLMNSNLFSLLCNVIDKNLAGS